MKHIFILNPNAGDGTHLDTLRKAVDKLECVCEIYETHAPTDATRYVRECCEKYTEPLRFYACGGDGTIKEVAEGILGYSHASMSCYPIGSGNDFVKYFGGVELFLDLKNLTEASDIETDLIRIREDNRSDTYSINVCNFGFDSCVAKIMGRVRRMPLLGGKNAYTTGIVYALFHAMRNQGDIYADGEKLTENGIFLLCTVANGSYVGGAYRCAPRASVNDGYLEVCVVRPVSLFTFVRLIRSYKAGTYLEDPRFQKYITYRRAKCIEAVSRTPFAVSLDGEIIETSHFVAEAVQGAVKFAAPAVSAAQKELV